MTPGPVVAIGGNEDKTSRCTVLRHVLALPGHPRPSVAVLAAASQIADERVRTYQGLFTALGAGRVVELAADPGSDDPWDHATHVVAHVDVVFLTGGSQSRLMDTVGPTSLAGAIRAAHQAGAVVAGTSAGASALTAVMMTPDVTDAGAVRPPGLGLLPGLLIDQHFTQRGRHGRLRSALAAHPHLAGLGIDEDTAAVIAPGELTVVGSGTLTVIEPGPGPAHVLGAGTRASLGAAA